MVTLTIRFRLLTLVNVTNLLLLVNVDLNIYYIISFPSFFFNSKWLKNSSEQQQVMNFELNLVFNFRVLTFKKKKNVLNASSCYLKDFYLI